MAHTDPVPSTTAGERIAGPHQSTVAAIVRAAELGLFTMAQAEVMIDRVRAHLTAPAITGPAASSSVADGVPVTVGDTGSGALPDLTDEAPYTFGAPGCGQPSGEPPQTRRRS